MNNVLIGIVLYKCELGKAQTYISLRSQITTEKIMIYDNSPEKQVVNSDIEYIYDSSNPGLSKAYNEFARYGKVNGYKWLIILDQDTVLPDNFLKSYYSSIKDDINIYCPLVKLINTDYYISPGPLKLKRIVTKGKKYTGILDLKKYAAINSGLMMNIDSFIDSGGYNELVTLDFSDFEFFNRIKKNEKKMMVAEVLVNQNLSNSETNPDTLYNRYKVYCKCINKCSCDSFLDFFEYRIVIIGRAVKLFNRTKQFRFIKLAVASVFNLEMY